MADMGMLRIVILLMAWVMLTCESESPVSSGWGSETTNGITASLRYPDGSPVPGARVRLRPSSYLFGESAKVGTVRDTTSGADGTFGFTDIPADSYTLEIETDTGYGLLFRVAPGITDSSWVDLGESKLRKTGKISGSVRMVNIPKEATITVRIYGVDRSTTVDLSGEYSIDDLPPGTYSLRLSSAGTEVGAVDIPSVTVDEDASTFVGETNMPIDYRVDSVIVRDFLRDQGLEDAIWEEIVPSTKGNRARIQQVHLNDRGIRTLAPSVNTLDFVNRIDLSGNPLTHLPEALASSGVESIDLSRIPMDTLIAGIEHFAELSGLMLDSTSIRVLPADLSRLGLKSLHLSGNNLVEIPGPVLQCTTLVYLRMESNDLSSLRGIESLTKLKEISFSRNRIDSLPDAISACVNLTRVQVTDNGLRYIPESLSRCPDLRSLWLQRNQIVSLPASLTQLKRLGSLRVGGNEIAALPEDIGVMASLRILDISSNPIRSLPVSVVNLTDIDVKVRNCILCETPSAIAAWLDTNAETDWRLTQNGCE